MNPRQRRGVLLIGLALVGSVAVFVAIVNYVSEVSSRVGPMVTVLRLSADVPPYRPVAPEAVEQVQLPQRWSPANALTDPPALGERVPTVPLPAGTVLQEGMLVEPPELRAGERELAILVDAETGVAGKIGRGSVVDIFATFQGSDELPPQANIVVENARILDVGVPSPAADENVGGFSQGEVVPVTFALSVDESLRLAYIESFAANVRLALRAPLDGTSIATDQRTYRPLGGDLSAPGGVPGPPPDGLAPPEPSTGAGP